MNDKLKNDLIKFLKHIGEDFCDDDKSVEIWPECSADKENKDEDDSCPDHSNCGICRYKYMKQKGWLSNLL